MKYYELSDDQIKETARRFTHHAPKKDQPSRYKEIRDTALSFALGLQQYCPQSRELSLALTHLESAVMYANAAIARREGDSD
jgi:hypothetical protein